MLDSETKRRINTCRDILVGKVPDPKSQVEQVTIALIYKFMDDMDLSAEEVGGVRSFFTGDFERYRWSKLLAPGVGGQEMLNLYTEALAKMVENPDLPELFRAIFRNAYLPYRDPETLRSFLREIDSFTYDHSERLGDAFEYLLSVLGSQGDAGQFRTPRHIIDFMVEIIDPKKDEVILDPACGTAGFLISSYKHILKANTTAPTRSVTEHGELDASEATLDSPLRYSGDMLTTEDRQRLANNIVGYDISPDMVRLSLVNLYLHGFPDPKVEEYDTLSSDDKWGETADVILANPPFMSPKGGSRPHTRFRVPSKRSEVLFVDYIAEHLTPNGRAAVVVPEGIIFQTQSSYIELRRLLLDKFLAAVVSLPAGVFNPYSGVKTSILIFDRAVAKACGSVAFFKVENDGFGLGAQRRAVKGTQLPQVKAELGAWLQGARTGEEIILESSLGHLVEKAKISEDGDFNLSGDRYREVVARRSIWPLVPLGEVTRRMSGGTPSKENNDYWSGEIPWVSPKDMKSAALVDTEDHISEAAVQASATTLVPADTVLCVVRSGILKHTLPVALTTRPMCFNQDIIALLADPERLDPRFLFWSLKGRSQEILAKGIKPGVTVQSFHSGFFKTFEIPLPPLEVQRELVAEIDRFQRIVDGAQAVLDNYRPTIAIDPTWPMVQINEIAKIARGASPRPIEKYMTDAPEGLNWIKIGDVALGEKFVTKTKDKVTAEGAAKSRKVVPGDLILSNSMSFGRPYIVQIEGYIHDGWLLVSPDPGSVSVEYLQVALAADQTALQFQRLATGGVVNNLNSSLVGGVRIPLPPLATQQKIVEEIEQEQKLVDSNTELKALFEERINRSILRLLGASDEEASDD